MIFRFIYFIREMRHNDKAQNKGVQRMHITQTRKAHQERREKILVVGGMIFVLLLHIGNIDKCILPYLSGDEMGPIGISAYFSGMDWSGTINQIGYYSYGYSILLWPLMQFSPSPEIFYKAAIIANMLMTSFIVPLAYSILKKVTPSKGSNGIKLLCAILISSIQPYFLRSHLASCETLLNLLTWVLTYMSFLVLKKKRNWSFFVMGGVLFYTYTVHQRMIGVLLAGVAVIFLYFLKGKLKGKQLIYFFLPILGLFPLHSLFKTYIQNNLWQSANNELLNDYSSTVKSVFQLFFDKQQLINTIRAFVGTLFYSGVATFLMFFVGIIFLLNSLGFFTIKTKRDDESGDETLNIGPVFVLLSFLATMLISSLFMGSGARLDHFVYGRYIEPFLGPIMLFGMAYIVNRGLKSWKIITAISIFSIGLGFLVAASLKPFSNAAYQVTTAFALNPFFTHNEGINVGLALCVCIIGVWLFFLLLSIPKLVVKATAFLSIICYTVVSSYIQLNQHIFPAELRSYEMKRLVNQIESTEYPVYYVDKKDIGLYGTLLQFLMWEIPIASIIDIETAEDITNPAYFFSAKEIYLWGTGEYTVLGRTNRLGLLEHREQDRVAENDIIYPLFLFYSLNGELINEKIISNGTEGFLIYGCYDDFREGEYAWELDIEILDESNVETESLGYVDMHYDSGMKEWMKKELTNESKGTLVVPFSFTEEKENVELRIYTYEGVQMAVSEVRLVKIQSD